MTTADNTSRQTPAKLLLCSAGGAAVGMSLVLHMLAPSLTGRLGIWLVAAGAAVVLGIAGWFVGARLWRRSAAGGSPWWILATAAALLIGAVLVLAIPLPVSGRATAGETYGAPARAGLFLLDAVALAALVTLLVTLLARRGKPREQTPRVSWWAPLMYALPCAAVWLLWWLAFWPGVMSADSLWQWSQATHERFNDWHPACHTMLIWLIRQWWSSPAAVGLVQIIALSLTCGWGLATLRRAGVPRTAVWFASALLALAPGNDVLVITLWKDVAYGITILALTVLVLRYVLSRGGVLARWWHWPAAGVLTALTALVRHNGPPAAFATIFSLAFAYPRRWLAVLVILAIGVGGWYAREPLYDKVGVDREKRGEGLAGILLHQVAAHVAAGTPLTPEEHEFLSTIHPLDTKWAYTPYRASVSLHDGRVQLNTLSTERDRFFQLWGDLLQRNPSVNAHHMLCASSLIWRITPPPDAMWLGGRISIAGDGTITHIGHGNPDLVQDTKLSAIQPALARWVVRSQKPDLVWLLWGTGLFLYVGVAAGLVAAFRRRDWRLLVVLLPTLVHCAVLVPLLPIQDFRYQYPVYLTGLMLWPLALCTRTPPREQPPGEANVPSA
ncbi:MAG: hypothetical protein PVJ57_06785 [Phycisphaerae bacterium]